MLHLQNLSLTPSEEPRCTNYHLHRDVPEKPVLTLQIPMLFMESWFIMSFLRKQESSVVLPK